MVRQLFLCLLVGVAFRASVAPAADARKPNVVLIVADDLGYGDLGCYGQKQIKTPNIDRLAREGTRFTQFYAGGTVGAASRAALFTGRHTGHATIRGNRADRDEPLASGDYTLSQMFRSVGYRVDGIGQWGLGPAGSGGDPKAKGFNQWLGFLEREAAHNYFPDQIWRYDSAQNPIWNQPVANIGRRYIHDVFTDAAANSIRINSDFQFLLYLPFTIPHANPALKKDGMQVPHDTPYSAEQWPQPEKNKASMITRLDASVGRLIAQLEQFRLQRDTIIIFTSDNGPHADGGVDPSFFKSSGPLRGIKPDLYEGGIRVPMIVWWPDWVEAGRVSDQVWAMWDVMPTLAEIIRAKRPEGDGISMLPTWLGQKQTNQHDHLYWESHERGFQQAVRLGDWKGVRLVKDGPVELYDLKSDEAEGSNVADRQPDVVARVEAIMRNDRTESAAWPTDGSNAAGDAPSDTKAGAAESPPAAPGGS